MSTDRPIRVGVFGAWRGDTFAHQAGQVGMELVAVCDAWEARLQEVTTRHNVAAYTDYDRFLEHDMDAVILANYFHQHAPAAVKALQADKHVMSECAACKTLGEGVALARAVEQSGKVYFFAENYAYFVYVQEMRRLYQAGEIGEIQYAEGEYVHPVSARDRNWLSPGMNHWRNWLPSTYYCTHALSPIIHVTETRPQSVNALSIPHSAQDTEHLSVRRTDTASVILLRLSNGAAARLAGIGLRGHGNWYRFHGTRGLMENLRSGTRDMLRIVHDAWDQHPGDVAEKIYMPKFPVHDELAARAGHGGGDFFTTWYFAEAIRTGEPPFMDVYRGLDMTLVGIQAWRSALANGAPFEIPDFRDEAVRKQYENDDWSPYPEDRRPGQPPASILGHIEPTPEGIAYARQVWDEMGYKGD